MDAKRLRDKLVGSDDERAVSPVIGVILMVAITVILAAVIATLVMDFGDSTEPPVNAVIESEVDDNPSNETTVRLQVTDAGNAERFELRGDSGAIAGGDNIELSLSGTGDVQTLNDGQLDIDDYNDPAADLTVDDNIKSYSLSIVAIDGDSETTVGNFDVNLYQDS